jgi:hypothetical protein
MRRDAVGDGELGRLRDLQHRYFQPPSDAAIRLENHEAGYYFGR